MVELGTLIAGRYELLALLGGGGGGLVYKARDRTTDSLIAVKVLRPHLLQDRSAREKFELEVRIAGRVRSEHLVKVHDAGLDPSTQLSFLVMEYLEGRTLEELVAHEGPLERHCVVEYLRQVAFGLDKVHAQRDADGRPTPTLHRDLKPGNLMLTLREDETPLVKILDWGIAKVLSDPGTVTYDIKGTPLYMAPEQLSPPAPLTPATDVFAMGLIAFFLLSGRSYWRTGQRADAILAAIVKEVCEGPVAPPRVRLNELGVALELPSAFDDWFTRCLNLDQAKRYQSAGEAARALAAALEISLRESHPPAFRLPERPAQVAPSPIPYQLEPPALLKGARRRRAGLYLVGFALGLTSVLSMAFIMPRPAGTKDAPLAVESAEPQALMALPMPVSSAASPRPIELATPANTAGSPRQIAAPANATPRTAPQRLGQGRTRRTEDDFLRNDELREAAEKARGKKAPPFAL